ncbi:ferric reductase-like transmembrane domain-containing protein [Sphingorhabdus sp. Alg239-R122]|uniref:sulfite oxidase heme-binding subunit YedZ n=1 Tax=Sphingorhabdus sp. Alg239-R122 TaxID=2305989 RepID=UPI0019688DCE|nr:ferric reductase-like transmembrane domain-containing protein [Sphingorhabdus sp. Alg239-R122]
MQFSHNPTTSFDLIHPTGEFSVRLMIIAMMISPLRQLFGRRGWTDWLLKRRRAIGVAAFGYALLHLVFYLIDMAVWEQVVKDAMIFSIWTGYIAFAIFTVMALTSNDSAMRMLRANWKRLQRFVYAAAILTALHWVYVDGEWRGALIHFIPLAALEIARVAHIFTKRSRKTAQVGTVI